ncbi:hypothetical protein, variant [Exophiala mesophila]|uniref:Uncharacterized protein n=1 Tax=Exophiala mesophila TaxID=212818 RepID=A0A0D1ZXX0_EXOME|nr:hypothetical protein, variant [Exophiala mesophila]KIV91713.1 hypothetical protein, variant [Exophiala mesophila]
MMNDFLRYQFIPSSRTRYPVHILWIFGLITFTALRNYIGFFTILWFTWLQTSLFDVRFGVDSVLQRIFNITSFGIMTGFAVVGAIYDTTHLVENIKGFRAMCLVLMTSRLILALQYGVILWFVRRYNHTWLPLLSTMGVLFLAAMGYLGTYWGFDVDDFTSTAPHTYYAWYGIAVAEAAAVITISSIWRVVSFKRTHLVERVGLLTLIIMGEGIIGVAKSVSMILQTSRDTEAADIGNIASSVLVIYFIWVLYFDQIEHERFGTIRQQVWAILHFPLHVAMLLTVEGTAALILWNIIARYLRGWIDYVNNIPASINSTSEMVEYLETGILVIEDLFKESHTDLAHTYNYHHNLTSISNISAPFNTPAWNAQFTPLLQDLAFGVVNAIFTKFGIEGPEQDETIHMTESERSEALANVFSTVFAYVYIAAGAFAMLLGVLYWFGKTRKSLAEWYAILIRVIFGLGLCGFSAIAFTDGGASDGFTFSAWPIPVIMFTYGVVILLDNLILWWGNRAVKRRNKQATQQHARPGMLDLKFGSRSNDATAQRTAEKLPAGNESAV